MRFILGETTCRGCGRLLDVMDDAVTVTPIEAAGTPWCGFFHRNCLSQLPEFATLLRRWREYTEKLIKSRAQYLQIIASSPRFLVARRTADGDIAIYYFDWWAEQRLHGADEVEEFAEFLTGDDLRDALAKREEAQFESSSKKFAVRIGAQPDRLQLSWTKPIGRDIEFPAREFEAYTAAHGPLAGFVDFVALAEEGLKPLETFGDLARCQGVVTRTDSVPKGYCVLYTAQQPVSIELGLTGLIELQNLLASRER